MANTKILIYQNDELIKKIDQAYEAEKAALISRANNVIALFSEFDESFEETGSTTAKYIELLDKGPQFYIDAAVSKIVAELSAAGIQSPAVVSISTSQVLQKGDGLIRRFNELQEYLQLKAAYEVMKFGLGDVVIVNGLAVIGTEKNLEGLKDTLARQFIDTEAGYDLVAKAENLVSALNAINDVLRVNNIYNITELNGFGDFADYIFPAQGANAQLEVNLKGIYEYARKIN